MATTINPDDLSDDVLEKIKGDKPAKVKPDKPKIPTILEKDFTKQFLQFAKLMGWRTAHFRAGMNSRGSWQTAVAGDGAGFPDIVLVRERIVWVELKSDKGTLGEEQVIWRDRLIQAKAEWYLWRPKDWPTIQTVLGRK